MQWVKAALRELAGLFVDDGSFAVAIVAWLAAAWLLLPRIGVPAEVKGAVLFAGLGLILLESVVRQARR